MPTLSPEIDTVIFDLDGTLRHSQPNGEIVFLEYAVKLGAPGDEETIRKARQWAHHYWASSECLIQDVKSFGVEGEEFWVAPPEYVILRKLEYYREGRSEKHLRDISGMLAVSGNEIDLNFLEKTVKRMNLDPQWRAALNFKAD